MTAQLRDAALRTYRTLLKAQKEVFGVDVVTREAARVKTRQEFIKNKSLEDSAQISKLISDANEMAQLLRRNVVQAVKVDEDRYLLKFDPTRHEMRDNEDDYMTKDGKLKPKSWEQPTPPRTKRRMGAKGAAAAAASTEGGCGSRGCGSDHAQPAQANA